MNAWTGNSGTISKDLIRVAAIGDVHCKRDSKGHLRPVFEQIAEEADILLVCGDITWWGVIEAVSVFAEEAAPALNKIPVLGVPGNHEFETGKAGELLRRLSDSGLIMLDGDSRKFHGVGFTGVKGFGGGFGRLALQPLGEPAMKHFANEVVIETQKLEAGLSRLDPGPKIVVMHYSPIRDTVAGEPMELYPFLGSSSLEGPLNRFAVTAAFHGHAHLGCFEGKTSANVPVYNVSVAVLKRRFPGRAPFFILEIPTKARTEC
jgi:Icc-related predicted phosphoesterase